MSKGIRGLRWEAVASLAAFCRRRDGRSLVMCVQKVDLRDDTPWVILALETGAKPQVQGSFKDNFRERLTATFDDHAHQTVGADLSLSKAFAKAEAYAQKWRARSGPVEKCPCDVISADFSDTPKPAAASSSKPKRRRAASPRSRRSQIS